MFFVGVKFLNKLRVIKKKEKMKPKLIIGILLILILGSCNSGYQKENNKWVWISYDEAVGKRVSQIDEHDVKTFKILRSSNYAVDKNSVFYVGRKIKDADPNSFEVINQSGYSKDKEFVFLDDKKVIFANPNTFKVLEFPYSKDDENLFCGTIPLEINKDEVEEFQVTNEDKLMSGTKSSFLLSYFIERNPDYEWLDTLGINGVIVGEWATGKTNGKKFIGFKELKE